VIFLEVPPLRRRRLGAQDLVERGAVVLGQLLLVERGLADHEVQVGLLVDAEVDLAALDVLHGLGRVGGDGAGLGVRHQAARAQHAGDAADLGHLVGGGDRASKSRKPPWIFSMRSSPPTCRRRRRWRPRPSPTANTDDAGGLTGAVRQVDGAAHHLVRLARVDAQRMATSTVASCFFEEVSLASFTASSGVYSRSRSIFAAASRYALLVLLIVVPILLLELRFAGRSGPPALSLR
jgi:hypothetical protein